jgi:hypothetical protein
MTIKELFDRLAMMPATAEVWIDDSDRHFAAPIQDNLVFLAGDGPHGRLYLFPSE